MSSDSPRRRKVVRGNACPSDLIVGLELDRIDGDMSTREERMLVSFV